MTRIGGFWRQHGAHLHRARVGAQKLALALLVRLKEEGVVHLARRVAGREVELGEVEVVAFDVRPFGDREAHVGEDGDDLVRHLADRMDAAGLDGGAAHRQGEVERLALELGFERGLLEHGRGGVASASVTASFSALIAAPWVLRSSGVSLPRVASRAETEPFLPRAATRTASSAGSSAAPSMAARVSSFRAARSDIGDSGVGNGTAAPRLGRMAAADDA